MKSSGTGFQAEHLRFPLDRRGYFRRECPDCHRQFKLRWSERDAQLVQRRLHGLLAHHNEHELSKVHALRHCPYCGHLAEADVWWTEEQRLFLQKRSAALGEEIRFEQLRLIERTLEQNPYPTFLPVAPVPFAFATRPEPDDMRVVPLVCCGEDVKVRESWTGPVICPFCGSEHGPARLLPPRKKGDEG